MDDRNRTIEKWFSRTQYKIPIYQRRYVWNKENWNILWRDIEKKFCLRHRGESSSHFLGTIIIRGYKNRGLGIPIFDILDGQQRLITFQIILCVISDICRKSKFCEIAKDTENLLINVGDTEKYTLYPKEGLDRDAFCALVDCNSKDRIDDHFIDDAYKFFKIEITDLVGKDNKKIKTLYETITLDFRMSYIDVKGWDDPEKIFASFHVPGRVLGEFDCLRNDLFLNAGAESEELYNKYWKHFDTEDYWTTQEKLESFLRHFLEAKLESSCFQKEHGREPKAFDLYQKRYRVKLKQDQNIEDIKYEFSELKRYSEIYQKIDTHSRMSFYKLFDITGWHSFILFLLGEKKIEENDIDMLLRILESYTMRRMLCYGLRFKSPKRDNLLSRLRKRISEFDSFSLEEFVKLLSDSRKPSEWPTDSIVESALRKPKDDFKENEDDLQCYILYQIELLMRKKSSIQNIDLTFIPKKFMRKHIMPPGWTGRWRLPLKKGEPVYYKDLFPEEYNITQAWMLPSEDDLKDKSQPFRDALNLAKHRIAVIESIGNITIVESYLSKMPTNVDFPERKKNFRQSKLMLNKEVSKHNDWDVHRILARTVKMKEHFLTIWPSAESFIEEITGIPPGLKSDKLIKSESSYWFNIYNDAGTDFINLRQIDISQFGVTGVDSNSKKHELHKPNILFALTTKAKSRLDSYLKEVNEDIALKQLPPDSHPRASQLSDITLNTDNYIKVITRRGSVLYGVIEHIDRYCIHIQINGQTVIIYKHGIENLELHKGIFSAKSDKMIQLGPYVFITDEKNIKLTGIKPFQGTVSGYAENNRIETLNKSDVLCACSEIAWGHVESKLTIDKEILSEIEKQDVPLTRSRYKRFKIDEWILKLAMKNQTSIKVVTYIGDVLRGTIEDFDEAAIYLKIGESTVIVFMHGLYEFTMEKKFSRQVIKFDKKTNDYGYFEFSEKPKRVSVHRSQILNNNPDLVQSGKMVEFSLTQKKNRKYLDAINVKPVKQ